MIQLVDLDGCISDDRWRRSFIDMGETDPERRYDAYHRSCGEDHHVNRHHLRFDCHIIIITARPERYRQKTSDWLRYADVPAVSIIMRPDDYHHSSVEIKEWALRWVFQRMNPEFVVDAIDDREDVVAMYRRWNLPARVVSI